MGDVEELLERASRIEGTHVDPAAIWETEQRRRRTRRAVQVVTATVAVLALATPVGIAMYRELSSPSVDVAETPDRTPGGTAAAGCPAVPADGDVVSRRAGAAAVVAVMEAAGLPLPSEAPDRFVDDDPPEDEAIDQLAALGVLQGTSRSPELFAPDAPLTRGQLASLLVRSYELTTGERIDAPADPFVDDDSSPHEPDTAKAAAAGLLPPSTSRGFAPEAAVLDGELARSAERLTTLLRGRELPSCLP